MIRQRATLQERQFDVEDLPVVHLIALVVQTWNALDGQPFDKAACERITDALEDAGLQVHHPGYYNQEPDPDDAYDFEREKDL